VEAIDGWDERRARGGVRREKEGGSDEWAPLVSEGKKAGSVPVRDGEILGYMPFWGWAGRDPRAFLPLVFVLLLFLFLFSISFITFAK
jgi:hypothetical protein